MNKEIILKPLILLFYVLLLIIAYLPAKPSFVLVYEYPMDLKKIIYVQDGIRQRIDEYKKLNKNRIDIYQYSVKSEETNLFCLFRLYLNDSQLITNRSRINIVYDELVTKEIIDYDLYGNKILNRTLQMGANKSLEADYSFSNYYESGKLVQTDIYEWIYLKGLKYRVEYKNGKVWKVYRLHEPVGGIEEFYNSHGHMTNMFYVNHNYAAMKKEHSYDEKNRIVKTYSFYCNEDGSTNYSLGPETMYYYYE